ncbi:hypothetical protein Q644_21650 [Brucella intermedia 229E]|uniref:Uncharacterized protein n=1 Tax=Brucella intermedia 229E TaxID=1337887 RepID=U4V8U9_9HYPH|nr:hypothetical protein Q644_21650 [Brucella intermedia 229E]
MMEPFRCIADLRGELMESPVWMIAGRHSLPAISRGDAYMKSTLTGGRFANGLSTARWQASD